MPIGEDVLKRQASGENFSGFLPNESIFQEQMEAQFEQIKSFLPISQEAFNADAASRGVFRSGEAQKFLYRDVYAPIAQSLASVSAKSRLAFQEAQLRARLGIAQLKQGAASTLFEGNIRRDELEAQRRSALFGGLGSAFGGIAGAFAGPLAERFFGGNNG